MATERGRTIIGEDLVVHGDIRNGGDVEVRGAVHGKIAAEHVVVHPGGRVMGSLDAGSADVHGLIDGRVRVRRLISIGANGAVHGDVRYGQLAMEPGGDLAADVRNVPPEIGGDFEVVVRHGRSVRITTADLTAEDREDGAEGLVYRVSNVADGHLSRASFPSSPVETFTQAEIQSRDILFVHAGGGGDGAGFDVVVTDSGGATSGHPRRVRVVVLAAV